MALQARCERLHVHRAARVLVTSRYSAERARGTLRTAATAGGGARADRSRRNGGACWSVACRRARERFTVLFAGRLYRRKRVDVLLRAPRRLLRTRIPELEVRIVGSGPCAAELHGLSRELRLEGTVTWLGDVSRAGAGRGVQSRRPVFCLPSVQEGFGIVLLEAMAAGKPIVAARAAAIPEVAPHATLVEPDSAEALAAGIEELYRSPASRAAQARAGGASGWSSSMPRAWRRMFLQAVCTEGGDR